MKHLVSPTVSLAFAPVVLFLAAAATLAYEPDQASRAMIESQLKTQLSVPGSLTIMYVDVTRPNDQGLQTACGWFVARTEGGGVQPPRAFAISFFTSAQVAKIHSIGENTAQVQTIKTFCNELGVDF